MGYREKAEVMDAEAMDRALTRIAHEILEANKGAGNIALAGIMTRGVDMANRLAERIARDRGDRRSPVGSLDISFYRDDVATRLSPEVHTHRHPLHGRGPHDRARGRRALHRAHHPRRHGRHHGLRSPVARSSWRCSWTAVTGSSRSARTSWARTCRPSRRERVKVAARRSTTGARRSSSSKTTGRGSSSALRQAHHDDGRPVSAEEIALILDTAESFAEVNQRRIKKLPTLRGRTVVNLFFEPSHAHAHVLRDRGQAPLGGRHQLLGLVLGDGQGRDAARHRQDARGDELRPGGGAPQVRGRAADARRSAWTARSSTAATACTSTPRRRCSTCTRCARRSGSSLGCAWASSATSATRGWPARSCPRCARWAPRRS